MPLYTHADISTPAIREKRKEERIIAQSSTYIKQ